MLYFTPGAILANTPQLGVFTFGTQPWVGRTRNFGFFVQDEETERDLWNIGACK